MQRFSLLSVLALAACLGDRASLGDDVTSYAVVADLLPESVVDVDLLFVIDDSGSMGEEQESLARWADDALFGVLELDPSTPLNLHVGVVSTDVGGGELIAGCEGSDGGVLQNTPRVADCLAPDGRFLIDVDDGAGGRIVNYSGTLGEAFGCIARLGTSGCGFEQPLEAMRRALDGSRPENAGFLRPGALLAVIFVTDEDDCSALDSALYDPSAPLGALSSFRCFASGVVCAGDDPTTPGAKTDCAPRDDSLYVTPVADYVDFLTSLKDDPSLVVVAAIAGDPDFVTVGTAPSGDPELAPSCTAPGGVAYPPVRIAALLDAFPERSRLASICSDDMGGPLADAAMRVAETAHRLPCLHGDIPSPSSCRVAEIAAGVPAYIPTCSGAGGDHCFTIASSPSCGHTTTGLAVDIRGATAGARTLVECATHP